MKRQGIFLLFCTTLILCSCAHPPSSTASQNSADDQVNYMQLSVNASEKLSSQQFAQLYAMFDDNLQAHLSEAELKLAWSQLLLQTGAFQYFSTDFTTATVNNTILAAVPFTFEKTTVTIQFSFNQQGQISGLYADSASPNRKISPRLPNDQEVLIGEEPWRLSGSLTWPDGEGPFPAVILLQDTGPSDRNEQIGPNLPFYDLANQLSAQGIAVLRYDKRTYTYAAEMLAADDMTINDEILTDAIAAYALISHHNQIDANRIYLLGHGFGGMILPLLAEKLPHAAGYILLAAPARPFAETYLEQQTYILNLDDTVSAENKTRILADVQQMAHNIQTLTPESTLSADELLGAPASYWLSLANYHPLKTIATLEKPLLILHGYRDYQTTDEDFSLWQQALDQSPTAVLKAYGNLNHLFMPGVGKSIPIEYQTKGTVSEEACQDIAAFIHATAND